MPRAPRNLDSALIAGAYCAQKDAYETDQTSNDIWGRNVDYNEATRKWDWGERDENVKVDVPCRPTEWHAKAILWNELQKVQSITFIFGYTISMLSQQCLNYCIQWRIQICFYIGAIKYNHQIHLCSLFTIKWSRLNQQE